MSPTLTPHLVYSPAQLRARHESTLRRAAAMIYDFDTILGFRVSALTPATYSRLVVIESPFLWRGAAGPQDVRDYLWLHSPQFDAEGRGRRQFDAEVARRLDPAWLRWRYSRAARHTRVAAGYALAAVEIADLVKVAFADEPPGGGEGGGAVSASLEAQMIDIFASRYRWDSERTRHTPLRRLYQFLRCVDRLDFDASEADVIAEELRQANAANLSPA